MMKCGTYWLIGSPIGISYPRLKSPEFASRYLRGMDTLRPLVKASRIKRMLELSTLEKEARQIHAEFEDHKRARRRLARRARKLAKHVRRRYPDMHIVGNEDGLHELVGDLAAVLHISNSHEEKETSDDTIHATSRSFEELFAFLKVICDVPWLKGTED